MLWETQLTNKIKISLIFLLVLIGVPLVFASCSGNQIDINSASLNELDELIGIGPVKAQAIIDIRPFDSVDDLIDVYGIGEITLEKIKEQGLACVDEDSDKNDGKEEISSKENNEKTISLEESLQEQEVEETEYEEEKPIEVIKLNTKNIKTKIDEEIKEEQKKNTYSLYGIVGFCILLGLLFILKRKKYKNEFD